MIIKKAIQKDFDRMADVWEDSVAETYDFLTMKEIASLKKILREKYLPSGDYVFYTLRENDGDEIVCFSGIIDDKIEFLFVDPSRFGHGIGKEMLCHLLKKHKTTKVDIHEANMHALSFYSKYGFVAKDKINKDVYGKNFPIVLLKLDEKNIDSLVEKLSSEK